MTETTKTMQSLVEAYDHDRGGDFYRIAAEDVGTIETELTAPYIAEIARLTARVAAADALRDEAKGLAEGLWRNYKGNTLVRDGTLEPFDAALAAYDATATTTAPDPSAQDEEREEKVSCSDLIGIAPDMTAGLPSEVWAAQQRGTPTPPAPSAHEPSIEFDWKAFQDSLTGEPEWKDAADLSRLSIEQHMRENGVTEEQITVKRRREDLPARLDALATRLDEQATCLSGLQAALNTSIGDCFALKYRMDALEAPRTPAVDESVRYITIYHQPAARDGSRGVTWNAKVYNDSHVAPVAYSTFQPTPEEAMRAALRAAGEDAK